VRPFLLVLVAALTAACQERLPEFGADVFASDTLPVSFTMSLTGSLAIGIRAEGFRMQPDKSLIVSAPAQLIVQRGEGTATITSLSGGRLAVQPLGLPPGSPDSLAAEGRVVTLTRAGEERRVTLAVERP
jgi:hypothetical protein